MFVMNKIYSSQVEDDSNQDQLLFLKQPIDVGALCEGGADLEFDFDRINLDGATLEEEVKVKENSVKETETKERQYGQMSAAAFVSVISIYHIFRWRAL